MEKNQLLEIEKYLKSKNLSSAVFAEVYDHFVMQISESINKQEISFPEAFVQTQIKWQNELEMVKADLFSFKRIARIERDILQQRFRKIMLISLSVSAFAWIVSTISEDLYFGSMILMFAVYFMFSLYLFIFRKMKFSEYRQKNFHPLLIRNFLILFLPLSIGYLLGYNLWDFLDAKLSHLILIYCLMVHIQLLYFQNKKINILLS